MGFKRVFKNFFNGVFMGTFEVVPGISGGTLAVLLNIYDKLIMSVSHIKDDFRNSVKFLTPIILGMVVGIFTFSYVILFLDKNYPMETNFLLLGLIVGLIPMLLARAVGDGFKIFNTIPFFLMFAVMIAIVCLSLTSGVSGDIIKNITAFEFFKFMFVGALASFCLLLPGCSGTMIMLVFGVYYSVMDAIHSLNVLILAPLGLGILFGLALGSKMVEFFFKKFPQATYFGILGLIVGSGISPSLAYLRSAIGIAQEFSITVDNIGFMNDFIMHGIFSVIALIFGVTFSYLFTRKAKDIEMKN